MVDPIKLRSEVRVFHEYIPEPKHGLLGPLKDVRASHFPHLRPTGAIKFDIRRHREHLTHQYRGMGITAGFTRNNVKLHKYQLARSPNLASSIPPPVEKRSPRQQQKKPSTTPKLHHSTPPPLTSPPPPPCVPSDPPRSSP